MKAAVLRERNADRRLRYACENASLRLEKLRKRDENGEPLYYLSTTYGTALRMEPPMSQQEAWDEVRARRARL